MNLLRTALRLNAASCVAFGLVFVALPSDVAAFLGEASPAPSWAVLALGAGLLANGLALWAVSRQRAPTRGAVLTFSAGDFAWVIATVVLIGAGIWIDTTAGITAAVAVAVLVGTFGIVQLAALQRVPAG